MKRIITFAIGVLAFAFYCTASQAAITSLTVTSVTISKSTGLLTVSGTIQCTAGDAVQLLDLLNQVQGGKSGLAEGFTNGTCTGGIDSWSATQSFFLVGSFKTGNTVVYAEAFDNTDNSSTDLTAFHQPITPVP